MILSVFAVDEDNGMGKNNKLPWPKNSDDMNWFKTTTLDQVIVMGKKTWNSTDMPNPLPNRINSVVTSLPININNVNCIKGYLPDRLQELQRQHLDKNIIVIGGPSIIMQSEPVLEKIYITKIPGSYNSDTYIDLTTLLLKFKLVENKQLNTCKIEIYERISSSS